MILSLIEAGIFVCFSFYVSMRGRRDRVVVGFTTTCAISVYQH